MVLAATACGPLPRVFEPEHKPLSNAFQQLDDIDGIMVTPVADMPAETAEPLSEMLAKAFGNLGIPASTHKEHRRADILRGTARLIPPASKSKKGEPGRLAIDWQLVDKKGEERGRRTTFHHLRPGDPKQISPETLHRIAQRSALEIAQLMHRNPHHQAPGRQQLTVAVAAVEGAPGDGAKMLPISIRAVLRQQGLAVRRNPAEADMLLALKVAVEPQDKEKDLVTILWEFRNRAGERVRRMRQRNMVPTGRMSQPWGSLAYDIAVAMAGAVRETLADFESGAVTVVHNPAEKPARSPLHIPKKIERPSESVDRLLSRLENTEIPAMAEPSAKPKRAPADRLLRDLERTRIDLPQ
jgi:hypothetical protein